MKKCIKRFFSYISGSSERIETSLAPMYGTGGLEEAVKAYRLENLKRYGLVLAVTLAVSGLLSLASLVDRDQLKTIDRTSYGDGIISLPVTVSGSYEGETITESLTVNIPSRKLTDSEKKEALASYRSYLENEFIAADEDGVRKLSGNIRLPDTDDAYGINVLWSSSDTSLLSDEGRINVTALTGKSQVLTLSAELTLGDFSDHADIDIIVEDERELYAASLKNRLYEVIRSIEANDSDTLIELPSDSGDGVSLSWTTGGNAYGMTALVAGLFVLLVIYMKRYDRAGAGTKAYRKQVIAEFPSVVDKLILLISSGMTVQNALLKISDDRSSAGDRSYIGRELGEIGRRVRSTNTEITGEWKELASRMCSADMLRFAAILEDNADKGVRLLDKLEAESESFREMRRKEIQKGIRTIDSKMMMPLMLMLFSLILITIAPAMVGF